MKVWCRGMSDEWQGRALIVWLLGHSNGAAVTFLVKSAWFINIFWEIKHMLYILAKISNAVDCNENTVITKATEKACAYWEFGLMHYNQQKCKNQLYLYRRGCKQNFYCKSCFITVVSIRKMFCGLGILQS